MVLPEGHSRPLHQLRWQNAGRPQAPRSRRSESPQAAVRSITGANDQAASPHRPLKHPGLSPKQNGLRKPIRCWRHSQTSDGPLWTKQLAES